MIFSNILINILYVIKNNFDDIYTDNDVSRLNIKNLPQEKLKDFINDSISFLEKETEFYCLYNKENNELKDKIEYFKELGKNLNSLKSKILKEFNLFNEIITNENKELFKVFLRENKLSTDFLDSNTTEKNFFKTPIEVISFFLESYKENILYNSNIKKKLNEKVGYNLFSVVINVLSFDGFFDVCPQESMSGIDDYNIYLRNHEEKFRIFLKKVDIISKFYLKNDIEKIRRIGYINDCLIDIYNNNLELNPKAPFYFYKINYSKETDIFESLFTYDKLSRNNEFSKEDSIEDKTLQELSEELFNDLTDYEIAYILYDYFIVFGSSKELLSDSEEFIFKDLKPLVEMINRRKKDGANFELLIDNLSSGKIKINLENKKNDSKTKQFKKKL